ECKIKLLELIEKFPRAAILTHVEPDGDGLAAALALQELFPHLQIMLEGKGSSKYDYLNVQNRTKICQKNLQFDLLIILDCHEHSRLGICDHLSKKAKAIIAIDHHIQGNLIPEAFTYIDTKLASVGAILFNMFKERIKQLAKASQKYVADSLYTTILNDTDNFINANTTAATFDMCAELMRLGLVPGEIANKFLHSHSANEMKLIGQSLATIQTYEDGKFLFFYTTKKMLDNLNLTAEATGGLSRWVKGITGVIASVRLQEIEPNKYKVHLRSNHLNVNKIATKYGGGGHKKASGCDMNGDLNTIRDTLLRDLKEQL
ncbi:MAG TPA: hypothetical protein DHM37_07675, partial [Candidatus Cloacimonas sp.]|nr:hypothetical protein [Candidatus Cloacimonas sp.]